MCQHAAPTCRTRAGCVPTQAESAARNAEPSEVTSFLLGLCREVNTWIAKERVLGQAPGTSAARLALVAAGRQVIGNALGLLGIGAPERM